MVLTELTSAPTDITAHLDVMFIFMSIFDSVQTGSSQHGQPPSLGSHFCPSGQQKMLQALVVPRKEGKNAIVKHTKWLPFSKAVSGTFKTPCRELLGFRKA